MLGGGLAAWLHALAPLAAPVPAQSFVSLVDGPVIVMPQGAGAAAAPEALRLRVRLPSGVTVALTPLREARGPGGALAWNGRRGDEARGPRAPDGRYRLTVETADGRSRPSTPVLVVLDSVPPRLAVTAADPVATWQGTSVGLRVAVRDRAPVRVRMIVTAVGGRPLAAGPWRGAGQVPLPASAAAGGRVGTVLAVIQGRDAAGNLSSSGPRAVVLPGSPGPARVTRRVSTARPWVALTVDDGYDPVALSSMVSTAVSMRAPLLLCVNGGAVARYSPALVARLRAAARDGWVQACNHGHSHATASGTPYGIAYRDIFASLVWDRTIGQSSRPFYRPPYGAVGPGIAAAAGDLGYRHVLLWDVDTNDWLHRSAERTTAHVMAEAGRGSVILMHGLPSSAAALPGIVRGLRSRGLEPVAIGDLLASGEPLR